MTCFFGQEIVDLRGTRILIGANKTMARSDLKMESHRNQNDQRLKGKQPKHSSHQEAAAEAKSGNLALDFNLVASVASLESKALLKACAWGI